MNKILETLNDALKMHRKGRADLAEPMYRAVVTADPECAEGWHLLGVIEMQKGSPSTAEPLLRKAVELDESMPKPHNNYALALVGMGRLNESEMHLRRAIELKENFVDAYFNLGNVLRDMGRPEDALENYERVLEINPGHEEALTNLGHIHQSAGDLANAEKRYRRAYELQPNHARVVWNLANVLEMRNKVEEAKELAVTLLEFDAKNPLSHIMAARLERRTGSAESAAERMRNVLESKMPASVRLNAVHEYGLALDRIEQAGRAFDAFKEVSNLKAYLDKDRLPDVNAYPAEVQASTQYFTHERLAAWKTETPTPAEQAPIFMVGFPRSGTTLFEQILGAHPNLVTSGEASPLARVERRMAKEIAYPQGLDDLTDEDVRFWRACFWDEVADQMGDTDGDKRFVDKLPLNIVRLGLVNKLFPEAKIIVSLRDPRDVCLSCFMQLFELNAAMVHFLKPETTAKLYAAVMDLWLHYRDALSVSWIEYRYEDLVDDMEGVTRKVFAFMDVEWDDCVLDYREFAPSQDIRTPSYRDVSSALYKRSIGRWTRYRDQLQPILPTLAPYVRAFGYEADTPEILQ